MKHFIRLLAILILTTGFMQPAWAEEKKAEDTPWEKISFRLGGFLTDADSSVQLGASGVGISVDPEAALGMDATTAVMRTDASWRFTDNKRHQLSLAWFAFRRDGDTTLAEGIEIGGTPIPAGSHVASSLDLDIYKLGYAYSFFQDDRMDLAISGGLFVMPLDFQFTASGGINEHQSANVTAPLPVLGFQADFAITQKWYLKNSFEVFYLKIGDFKGSIIDASSAVEYNAFKNVGFGLAFNTFNLNVEAQGNDYPEVDFFGAFDFRYTGFFLYGKVFF